MLSLIKSLSTLSNLNNSPSTNTQPQIQIKASSQPKYEDDVEYVSYFPLNIPPLLIDVPESSAVAEPRSSTRSMKGQGTQKKL